MHAQARIEERPPPVPPPANDTQAPDFLEATASRRHPAENGELAFRSALRQWIIFSGVIGAGLLALVLSLKA